MSELEDKLNSVLSNPQMMQQIMALAQGLEQQSGAPQAAPQTPPQTPPQPSTPAPALQLDPGLLQMLSGLTAKSGVDGNQQALLAALSPYLSRKRVEKLEKAMRAARMTELASTVLGSGALQSLMGR